MCTYVTAQAPATGAGRGRGGWFALSRLTVYYDHPVAAQYEHTMNIDFAAPERGADARVGVELSSGTALDLVRALARVLVDVPADLTGVDPDGATRLLEAAEALTVSAG